MGKKKKSRPNLVTDLRAKGKSAAEAMLKGSSETNRKMLKEDITSLEQIFKSDPSLYDTLFDAVNNCINLRRGDVREAQEAFIELMGDRVGLFLFWLLDMSPYQSRALLKRFNASEKTIAWLQRCFLMFGTAISHLEKLEKEAEDWRRLRVERLRKDGSKEVLVKVMVTRYDGQKQTLLGPRASLFQLAVKLLDQITNGGREMEKCDPKYISRAEKILTEMCSKKASSPKKSKKQGKKKK